MSWKSEGQLLSSHLFSWWQRKALVKVGPSRFPIPTLLIWLYKTLLKKNNTSLTESSSKVLKKFLFKLKTGLSKTSLWVLATISMVSPKGTLVNRDLLLLELFVKICHQDKKDIYESLLKLFVKKMSLIISLVVLFIT